MNLMSLISALKRFSPAATHSDRRLFTGLAIEALIAWKLMVSKAINTAARPESGNTHALIFIR